MRRSLMLGVSVAAFALTSCSEAPKPATVTVEATKPTVTVVPVVEAKIEVRTVNFAGLEKEIQSYKGKVVLVDVWSLG